jgi:hypothetical protein
MSGITDRTYIDIDLLRGLSSPAVTISTDTVTPWPGYGCGPEAPVRPRCDKHDHRGDRHTAIEAGAQPGNILVRGERRYEIRAYLSKPLGSVGDVVRQMSPAHEYGAGSWLGSSRILPTSTPLTRTATAEVLFTPA